MILRPISPEDSASFWNGDDERVIRLSAFYELRVVLLEPEAPTELPGYVLSLGNYVRPQNALYIDTTESVVRFTPPGSSEKVLTASPARPALEFTAYSPPDIANNTLILTGSGFTGGRLVLRSPLFVGAPQNQIVVDPALNASWKIKVTPTRITALIQPVVNDAQLGPLDVLPGLYGVSVRVATTYNLPGGLTKDITTISNEQAVAITPFIASNGAVGGGVPPVSVDLNTPLPGPDLTDPNIDDEAAISVIVAGQVYKYITGGVPGLREFVVAGSNTITIGAHFNNTMSGIYPVRLIIRGADAPPYWIEVP